MKANRFLSIQCCVLYRCTRLLFLSFKPFPHHSSDILGATELFPAVLSVLVSHHCMVFCVCVCVCICVCVVYLCVFSLVFCSCFYCWLVGCCVFCVVVFMGVCVVYIVWVGDCFVC